MNNLNNGILALLLMNSSLIYCMRKTYRLFTFTAPSLISKARCNSHYLHSEDFIDPQEYSKELSLLKKRIVEKYDSPIILAGDSSIQLPHPHPEDKNTGVLYIKTANGRKYYSVYPYKSYYKLTERLGKEKYTSKKK